MSYKHYPSGIGGMKVRRIRDPRTFSRAKYFGAAMDVSSIPGDFDLAPGLPIENQYLSSLCTAFANALISGIQESKRLSPEYAFYKTRVVMGGNPHVFGADSDAAMKAHIKFGCIEKGDSPFTLEHDGQYLIEDPKSWEEHQKDLDAKAASHQKESFFEVDGYGNRFDSIRATMYQSLLDAESAKNPSLRRAVSLGLYWQPEWSLAFDGIVPKIAGLAKQYPHNVVVRGTKMINGEVYLLIQNSSGDMRGDKGLWYFPANIINGKHVIFSRTFEDVDPNEVKLLQWGILALMYNYLANLWKLNWPNTPLPTEKKSDEPVPVPPVIEPKPEHKSRIVDWGNAIAAFENAPAHWNNPGAIKGANGKFLTFTTRQEGMSYLCDYLIRACTGVHKAYPKGGATTLIEFQRIYSPSHDSNNPDAYCAFVAGKLGVSKDIKIGELL